MDASFAQPWLLLLLPVAGGVVVWLWREMASGLGRRRQWVVLAIRLVLVTLVILAMAGLTWQQPQSGEAVVLVGDLSTSAAGTQARMEAWIRNALTGEQASRGDQAGIVAFGRDALVEQNPSASGAGTAGFDHFESIVDPDYTNVGEGLDLAAALLPPDLRRRVVLLSDGQQNLGDAVSEAQILRAEGARVDVVPMSQSAGPEMLVDSLTTPGTLHKGEQFNATVTVESNVATPALMQIFADGRPVASRTVNVQPGVNTFAYSLTADVTGYHTYRVQITPPAGADTVSQNNTASSFSQVLGPPRVLVISTLPGGGHNVAAALMSTGVSVTQQTAAQVAPTLAYLQQYAAMVIVDTPADVLGPDLLALLPAYVRDLGHGLAVIGGQNSYALGNYGGTPLEDVLPVSMDVPQRQDSPSVAVVLIIESLESDYTVNISKEAGKGVVDLLTSHDQVAVSDAATDWAVPMRDVTDKKAIDAEIDAMQPGDPPSYAPYLQDALTTLQHTHAAIKHIILLGDGDAEDNYQPLIQQIVKSGITVSTVATGVSGPTDFTNMSNIARWGKGRYSQANNVLDIPRIFLQETRQIARNGMILDHFYPDPVADSALLDGLTSMPELDGYVATTAKPTAQMVLISRKADPILAQWQYGQGRAVAWTSDSEGLWSSHLLAWPQATRLWSNIVSWILPPPQSTDLTLTTSSSGGAAHIAVDVAPRLSVQAAASGGARLSAIVVGPNLITQTVALQATSPGHYEADVDAGQEGVYLVKVDAMTTEGHGVTMATTSGGLAVPYSPEYSTTGPNTRVLHTIAAAGGGAVLSAAPSTAAQAAFADNLAPASAPRPLTDLLLLLALLVLPFDVAVRRLMVSRRDIETIMGAAVAVLPGRRWATSASEARASTITSTPLESVRARRAARTSRATTASAVSTSAASQPPTVKVAPPVSRVPSEAKAEPVASGHHASPTQNEGDAYAGRLLEAKRRRRQ